MPRSFALGERFEAFIDDEVDSGRYGTADDVVREGLRLLKDASRIELSNVDVLARMVEKARADTTLHDGSDVFKRLESRLEGDAKAKGL